MVVVGSGKALSNLNCMVSKPPEKTKNKNKQNIQTLVVL